MRIDRLHLKAYGCFTGTTLDFAASACGMSVVYGSNEAGKTKTSAAIDSFPLALSAIQGIAPAAPARRGSAPALTFLPSIATAAPYPSRSSPRIEMKLRSYLSSRSRFMTSVEKPSSIWIEYLAGSVGRPDASSGTRVTNSMTVGFPFSTNGVGGDCISRMLPAHGGERKCVRAKLAIA